MNTWWLRLPACALVVLALAACGTSGKRGGYYQDDGPGSDIPPDIARIPDAVPRIEPFARANLRPYTVMGRRYVPIADSRPFRQEGIASWYGRKFHGKRTANGERYDMYAMTAAHPTLPLPSYARVTRLDNGRSVVVRINDRGPFLRSRVIDLSYAAAARLGFVNQGSARVRVEAITHDDIRLAQRRGTQLAGNPATIALRAATEPTPVSAPPRSEMGTPIPSTTSPAQPARLVPSKAQPTVETPDALQVIMATDPALPDRTDQPTPVPVSIDPHPTAVTSPPAIASGSPERIYLQFGAFSAAGSAESLARRLNTMVGHLERYPAHVQQANGLHRVRMGPYPSRTEAVNAAVRIQEQTGKQPTIALQ